MPARGVAVVHSTPGRVRLRLPWLHDHPEAAERIADALAALGGVEDVQVRAWTGSVLCRYDPVRVAEERIARAAREAAGASEAGEGQVPERRRLARIARRGTSVTKTAAALFKGLDADVLRATDGHLDLADTAALGMVAVAIGKLASAERLPLPSWYDLLWYAYTVFSREERAVIDQTPHPLTGAEPQRAS